MTKTAKVGAGRARWAEEEKASGLRGNALPSGSYVVDDVCQRDDKRVIKTRVYDGGGNDDQSHDNDPLDQLGAYFMMPKE